LSGTFDKVVFGSRIAARIGLQKIRGECRHFDAWLSRLEALANIAGI